MVVSSEPEKEHEVLNSTAENHQIDLIVTVDALLLAKELNLSGLDK